MVKWWSAKASVCWYLILLPIRPRCRCHMSWGNFQFTRKIQAEAAPGRTHIKSCEHAALLLLGGSVTTHTHKVQTRRTISSRVRRERVQICERGEARPVPIWIMQHLVCFLITKTCSRMKYGKQNPNIPIMEKMRRPIHLFSPRLCGAAAFPPTSKANCRLCDADFEFAAKTHCAYLFFRSRHHRCQGLNGVEGKLERFRSRTRRTFDAEQFSSAALALVECGFLLNCWFNPRRTGNPHNK